MKVISSLADVNFSIEDAATAGYKIRLDSDGCAEILKDDGTAYHVHDFSCDFYMQSDGPVLVSLNMTPGASGSD